MVNDFLLYRCVSEMEVVIVGAVGEIYVYPYSLIVDDTRLLTGVNPLTDQKLTRGDKGFAALGLILGVGSVNRLGKTVDKAADIKNLEKATRGTGNIVRLGDDGINYAVSNQSRMQHAFKHAKDLGFRNWNKQTARQWNNYVSEILRTLTKSFDNKLG